YKLAATSWYSAAMRAPGMFSRLSRTISRNCSSLDATSRVRFGIGFLFSWQTISGFVAPHAAGRDTGGKWRNNDWRQPEKIGETLELVIGDADAHRIRNTAGATRSGVASKLYQAPSGGILLLIIHRNSCRTGLKL